MALPSIDGKPEAALFVRSTGSKETNYTKEVFSTLPALGQQSRVSLIMIMPR
jgi:hypothetical protein